MVLYRHSFVHDGLVNEPNRIERSSAFVTTSEVIMAFPYDALYLDLLEDLTKVPGYQYGDLAPECSPKAFAAKALEKSFYKKLVRGTSSAAEAAALDKFLLSNSRCKNWELRKPDLHSDLLLGLFRQELWRFFNNGNLDPLINSSAHIAEKANCGPGASLLARGNDFYTKLFDSPLSGTSDGLYRMYTASFSHLPNWANAERVRFSRYGKMERVRGNRLSYVPKTDDIARVICTEPNLNMFFQKGLAAIVEQRLERFFGINLSRQPHVNCALARIGSLDGSFATIDLSSASDTVSLSMLETFLPPDVFGWISGFRSKECQLPSGDWEKLYMVSSQGNGFTFALETAIFASVVTAVYHSKGIRLMKPNSDSPNFGVFGDDIVCRSDCYDAIVKLLNLLGFEVNTAKSFKEGPFRESCGGDYFLGHPVRGVYIKSLETQQSRYVAINRLNLWSAYTGISLPRTITRLRKKVRWLPVPLRENDDAGIRVPLSFINPKFDVNNSYFYKKTVVRPKVMKVGEAQITTPKGVKDRYYNVSGLLLAFLRGDIENCTVNIRNGYPQYSTRNGVTPNWDYIEQTAGDPSPVDRERLVTAIWANMTS